MKGIVRAALVAASAVAFCVALSSIASADVVEPESAYQPASSGLVQPSTGAKGTVPTEPKPLGDEFYATTDKEQKEEKAEPVIAKEEAKPIEEPAVATPAPEQVVRQAPAHLTQRPAVPVADSPIERVTRPLRTGFQLIGSYLERVASACQVGFGTGTGGPVLVLAVLSLAAALNRHRTSLVRPATDEDVPELLYAWKLTPPG